MHHAKQSDAICAYAHMLKTAEVQNCTLASIICDVIKQVHTEYTLEPISHDKQRRLIPNAQVISRDI